MRKRNILIALFAMLTVFNMHVNAIPVLVPMQVGIEDPTNGQGTHRGPVNVPCLVIDDYCLQIPEYYNGCQLCLVDEDGVVAYSTVIPEGCEEIVLPSNLSGDYEIQLIRGNFCFFGYLIF